MFNNLTREELTDRLDEAQLRANNGRYSWLAVWILSHQRKVEGVEQVFGCNGVGVDINKVRHIKLHNHVLICLQNYGLFY